MHPVIEKLVSAGISRSVAENVSEQRRILVTGAAGRIGTAFREFAGGQYRLRLADRRVGKLKDSGGHEVVRFQATNLKSCRKACEGVDTVIHLAANASPKADFYSSLLDNNIKGTYNIFRAAKEQGCRRVVFASSSHVVMGHSEEIELKSTSPLRPINMYGVSKCFGEAVAHYFAFAEGLSSIVVRIGFFEAEWIGRKPVKSVLRRFISRRDMSHLLVRCVEAPDIQYAVVHGVSENRFQRLDLSTTKELLNYRPQDDGFQLYGEGSDDAETQDAVWGQRVRTTKPRGVFRTLSRRIVRRIQAVTR